MGSPTLRRRRLARELARLRDETGMTIEAAATAVGISTSHLSRVERAQVGVRLPVVKLLLALYGADEETGAYLIGIAKEATTKGWWHRYIGSLPERYATYIGFEAEATQLWNYEAATVPGLLQTEDYITSMLQGGASRYSDEEIEQRVAVRMRRQQLLYQEAPPRLWFILDEAALRRQVGGPRTLADQLRHITDVAALPHVDIQVVPFSVGAHPGTPGSFVVLQFSEPADAPVVYVETMAGDLYPEDQASIDGTILAFDRLRAMALGPDASAAMIREITKELA